MTDLRPFRHLCGEADLRDAMTDEEFWAHVFSREAWRTEDDFDPAHERDLTAIAHPEPCAECGQPGACAYDDLGRPLIHTSPKEDHQP